MAISNSVSAVLAFSYAFIMIFGSISNALVVLTYIKWRWTMLRQPADVLILSLSVGDFTISFFVCPLGFASASAKGWLFGRFGCIWYGFISTWVGLSSIVQLSFLAIERYITLSNPTPNPVTSKRAFQAVLVSWALSLMASCFPLMGWSQYTFEGFGFHCSILWESSSVSNTSYCLFLLIVFFAVPVSAIVFSYAKIFFIVRRIYLNADTMWGAEAQATKETYQAQVKIAKQLLMIIAGFMFAWTPYAAMSAIPLVFDSNVPIGYREYPALFAKMSNIYNPVIYFFTYERLRKKTVAMLKDFGAGNSVHPQ